MLASPLLLHVAFAAARPRLPGRAGLAADRFLLCAPFLILLGVFHAAMRLENMLDPWITSHLGWDATALVRSLEGDFVARLQSSLRRPWLDEMMVFVYTTLYLSYHFAATFGFAFAGEARLVRRVAVTWVIVWLVALPFYVLVPVWEVWASEDVHGFGSGIVGILAERGSLQAATHRVSDATNSFPSLHNAFAWAFPALLLLSGWRRAALLALPFALLITFSTLYLGIHWVVDAVAGAAVGVGAAWAGCRMELGVSSGLWPVGLRWRPAADGAKS